MCVYIYIYIYTYIYTHIHICIRTHNTLQALLVVYVSVEIIVHNNYVASLSTSFYILQRGVQWKQGVVIRMLLYTILLCNTTPIHYTPLPLHPPVMNTHRHRLDGYLYRGRPLLLLLIIIIMLMLMLITINEYPVVRRNPACGRLTLSLSPSEAAAKVMSSDILGIQ